MTLIRFLFRSSRGPVLLLLVTSAISGASVALILSVINAMIAGAVSAWGVRTFAILCLLLLATRFTSWVLLFRVCHDALVRFRLELSEEFLRAPLPISESVGSDKFLSAVTEDAAAVVGAVPGIPITLVNSALVLGCMAFLASLSLQLFFKVVTFLVLASVLYRLIAQRGLNAFISAQRTYENLLRHFQALSLGLKELKLSGAKRREFIRDTIYREATDFRGHSLRGVTFYNVANVVGYAILLGAIGLVIASTAEGEVTKRVGTGFVLVLWFIGTPLEAILQWAPAFGRAKVSLERIGTLRGLFAGAECPGSKEYVGIGPSRPPAAIELRGVSYRYPSDVQDEAFVLGPIDLTIEAGQVIILSGGNGSGKSTLAKLICGLYTPIAGEVLYGNQPITQLTQDAYREHFAAVFADFHLFEKLYGLDGKDVDIKAVQYLERLRLAKKVTISDGQLSTIKLSSGQRRRLALLTAQLEDRAIYLFDEWASDQDPSFKRMFYEEIVPDLKARGKTVMIVTHDERFFSVGDRVVALQDGRILSNRCHNETASSCNENGRTGAV